MRSSKRQGLEVVPVVVSGEGFNCMDDERLNRRLRRRNVGTQSFKVNLNGKGNICKGKRMKSISESVCIQNDGYDSDVGDEDYMKFYNDLVRGMFVDNDAHLHVMSYLSKKNIGRYKSRKCIESPSNAPKSSSSILLDDDDDDNEVDEHNRKFLKNLDEGWDILYEEDEQSSSDSGVIVTDTNQFFYGNDTPFVISKGRILEDEDWRDKGVSSKFREELMKILEKPYNEREYGDLWQMISHRHHVERNMSLRSGTRRFETKAVGKSYLDHHADLEAKIQSSKSDRPEILNLMRGFFHWLMNTPHDGSGVFRPWLDSSCLKVRPQHNKGIPLIKLQQLN